MKKIKDGRNTRPARGLIFLLRERNTGTRLFFRGNSRPGYLPGSSLPYLSREGDQQCFKWSLPGTESCGIRAFPRILFSLSASRNRFKGEE